MNKNIWKIIFVAIGTLVGAGFASGKEIYVFFYSFGINGFIGILIASILLGAIVFKVIKIMQKENISNHKEFLIKVFKVNDKNKIIEIISIIINIFTLITFFIMIAGFGAYFEQQLGINKIVGSIVLAVLSFFVLIKKENGVSKVNQIIVPILITIITVIFIINFKNIEFYKNQINLNNNWGWLLKSLMYAGYNGILLIPVIISLKKYVDNIKTKKEKRTIMISIITIIFTLASFVFFMLFQIQEINISEIEMPMVYVVSEFIPSMKVVYGILILASIVTTSVSLGMSFLKNTKRNYNKKALLICAISVLIANIGFSNLINYCYPAFGVLGIIEVIRILMY